MANVILTEDQMALYNELKKIKADTKFMTKYARHNELVENIKKMMGDKEKGKEMLDNNGKVIARCSVHTKEGLTFDKKAFEEAKPNEYNEWLVYKPATYSIEFMEITV